MRDVVRRTLLGLAGCVALAPPPAAAQPASPEGRTARIFELVCAQCHLRPGIGVPQISDAVAWKKLAAQGEETLLANTVNGLRGMPPLGTCSFCSEEDLRLLIAFLAGLPLEAGSQGEAGP